jgi:hypothetical protein
MSVLLCTNARPSLHQCPSFSAPMPVLLCANVRPSLHQRPSFSAPMSVLLCTNACPFLHQCPSFSAPMSVLLCTNVRPLYHRTVPGLAYPRWLSKDTGSPLPSCQVLSTLCSTLLCSTLLYSTLLYLCCTARILYSAVLILYSYSHPVRRHRSGACSGHLRLHPQRTAGTPHAHTLHTHTLPTHTPHTDTLPTHTLPTHPTHCRVWGWGERE